MSKITLYSTGCPKCKVLKKKLDDLSIAYEENTSVDEMLKLGIMSAPTLQVDDKIMPFQESIKWVKGESTK